MRVAVRDRRRSAALIILATVTLLGLVDLVVIVHPEQLRRRLETFATHVTHAEVRFGALSQEGLGTFAIGEASLASRDGSSRALASGLKLRYAPVSLLRGLFEVLRVEVDHLSSDVDALPLVLDGLAGAMADAADAATLPPVIEIRDVQIHDLARRIPLLAPAGDGGLRLTRVRFRPERGSPRYWQVAAESTVEGERLALSGRVDLEAGFATLALKATNAEIEHRGLAAMPAPLGLLGRPLHAVGPIDIEIEAQCAWRDPGPATLRTELVSYSLTLRPDGLARPITNVRGRLVLEDGGLRIQGLRGAWGDVDVHATGWLRDAASLASGEVDIEAATLDLDDVRVCEPLRELAYLVTALDLAGDAGLRVKLRAAEQADGAARPSMETSLAWHEVRAFSGAMSCGAGRLELRLPAATATIELESGSLLGLPIASVTASLKPRGATLHLDSLDGVVADGRAKGRATITRDSGWSLELVARRLDLTAIAAAFAPGQPAGGTATEVMARLAANADAEVRGRLDATLVGVSPLALRNFVALRDALLGEGKRPTSFDTGHVTIDFDDRVHVVLDLGCEGLAIGIDVMIERDREHTLRGTVRLTLADRDQPVALDVSGTLDAPRLSTNTGG